MRTTRLVGAMAIASLAAIGVGGGAVAAPSNFPSTVPMVDHWAPSDVATAWSLTSTSRIFSDLGAEVAAERLADALELDYEFRPDVIVSASKAGDAPGAGDIALSLNEQSSNTYEVTVGTVLALSASDAIGLQHAATTVLQALRTTPTEFSLPAGTVTDSPDFEDRGMMLDVGRRYLPVDYIEQQIEQMAWYKMSTLHLHLTDWNGFRIESEVHPDLASEDSYSLDELRRLDAFAAQRGITIIPEVDVPAHATAITTARPDLALECASMSQPNASWEGSDQPGWTLDYTSEATRDLVKDLATELASVFSGPYIHIGTDEVPLESKQLACPELTSAQQDAGYPYVGDLLVDFINDINTTVRAQGKTMQIWQWWDYAGKTSINPETTVSVNEWLSDPRGRADKGYATVGSQDGPLYVSVGFGNRPGDYGFFNVNNTYANYPFAQAESGNILGYRVSRWMDRSYSYSLDFVDYMSRRPLAVVAERTWSEKRTTPANFFDRYTQVGDSPFNSANRSEILGEEIGAAGAGVSKAGWQINATSEELSSEPGKAQNAIDNDPYTFWHSRYSSEATRLPQALELDAGLTQRISGLRYTPRQDGGQGGRVAGYRVEVSEDGHTWTEVATGTLPDGGVAAGKAKEWQEETIRFAPVSARHVRFVVTSEHGPEQRYASVAALDLLKELPSLAAEPLLVSAKTRCFAGQAHVAVRSENVSETPLTVDLASDYGTQESSTVEPGHSIYVAFPARVSEVPGGSVTVSSGHGPITASYAAVDCTQSN